MIEALEDEKALDNITLITSLEEDRKKSEDVALKVDLEEKIT